MTRKNSLIVAAILILFVNALTLSFVVYNRSDAPDSTLHLSHRELVAPYGMYRNKENSGISLSLRWRVEPNKPEEFIGRYYYVGNAPPWLTAGKLASLGFDVSKSSIKQLPRDVLLVLEIAGPAYRRAVEQIRQYAAHEEALAVANPGAKDLQERAKAASERLSEEINKNSRLFVIDAGLDHAALRARYADRTNCAIVRGRIRTQWLNQEKSEQIVGHIDVSVTEINVPQDFRFVLEPLLQQGDEAAYVVDVAFGKRFEPWVIGASKALSGRSANSSAALY